MSATDHTLTDAERAMFERIEDTGDTQGLTWRVQELVAEARALADEESASRVALANQLATAEAEKEALRASKSALVEKVKRLQDQIARANMEPGQDRQKAMHAYAARAEAAEAEKEALRERVEYVRRDSNRRRVRQVRQLQGRLTELAGVAEERGYDVQAQMERAEAAEAALTGLVAAVEAVAEASLRDGRGGTWVHDEWFRALLTADTKATS